MASTTSDVRKMYAPPPAQARDAAKGMQAPPGSEAAMAAAPDCGEASYVGSNRLAGKACLVTGGDSGIGRAVCLAFAREGADVAVAWSGAQAEEADARKTAELVEGEGRKAALLAADLRGHDACVQLVDSARAAGLGDGPRGGLDVLVLNHATQPPAAPAGGALAAFPRADWDRILETNVSSFWSLVGAAVPHMAAERGPAVIMTTSIEAYTPEAGERKRERREREGLAIFTRVTASSRHSHTRARTHPPPKIAILPYAVSKAAIRGLIQGLAPELAKSKGIRVNGVAPGETQRRG